MQPSDGQRDEASETDVTRRTWLAGERTYLAWWRTALTALAAGLAVSRVVPALTNSHRTPYVFLGAGYSVLGLVLVLYAYHRQQQLQRALREGRFSSPDATMLVMLTLFSVALGLGTVVLVFVQ